MRLAAFFVIVCATTSGSAHADAAPLHEYLTTMNHTRVTISGEMSYGIPRDDTFIFYDENGDFFPVTMDTGRQIREEVEKRCQTSRSSYGDVNRCGIEAVGTVEIRGSTIHISVDEVLSLSD